MCCSTTNNDAPLESHQYNCCLQFILVVDLEDIINAAPELDHAVKQRVNDITINYTCHDNYYHPDNGFSWTVTADCTYWANVTDCVGE